MSNSKYSNEADTVILAVLQHPKVQEAIDVVRQEAYNAGIDAAVEALPEKMKHQGGCMVFARSSCSCGVANYNGAIDQAKSNLKALIGGDV